jgi:hypothetical protein
MQRSTSSLLKLVAFLILWTGLTVNSLQAQIRVGLPTAPPDGSAALDVSGGPYTLGSPYRGIAPPKVALTQTSLAAPVTRPVQGLLVYNTATANDVTPGYYFWDGNKWLQFAIASHGSARVAAAGGGQSVPAYLLSEIQSLTTTSDQILLVEPGREGLFRYVAGDTSPNDSAMVLIPSSGKHYVRYADFVKPEWFGANGADNVDDYKALQAALAKGLRLELTKDATYLIRTSLTKTGGSLIINGNGATIKSTNTYTGAVAKSMFILYKQANILVRDLSMDGNRSGQNLTTTVNGIHAFTIDSAAHINFENVTVSQFPSNGFFIKNSQDVLIDKCRFLYGLGTGVFGVNCTFITTRNSRFIGLGNAGTDSLTNGGIGFLYQLCDRVTVEGCSIEQSGDTGSKTEGCDYVIYKGNYVRDFGKDGLKVHGYAGHEQVKYAIITNNIVKDAHYWRSDGSANILVHDCAKAIISNNIVEDNTKELRSSYGIAATNHLSFNNNLIIENNQVGVNNRGSSGIFIVGNDASSLNEKVTISGNVIYANVSVTGFKESIKIDNNQIYSTDTYGLVVTRAEHISIVNNRITNTTHGLTVRPTVVPLNYVNIEGNILKVNGTGITLNADANKNFTIKNAQILNNEITNVGLVSANLGISTSYTESVNLLSNVINNFNMGIQDQLLNKLATSTVYQDHKFIGNQLNTIGGIGIQISNFDSTMASSINNVIIKDNYFNKVAQSANTSQLVAIRAPDVSYKNIFFEKNVVKEQLAGFTLTSIFGFYQTQSLVCDYLSVSDNIALDGTALYHNSISNYSKRTNGLLRSAIPTLGTWVVNDIIYNSATTPGSPLGWKCIASGSPGSWAAFGHIGVNPTLQSKAGNPTTSEIPAGQLATFKNTTTSSLSDWTNDGGNIRLVSPTGGLAQFNGDTTTNVKQFAISHGLSYTPTIVTVSAGSVDAAGFQYILANATAITVYYSSAPATGTNNIKLYWTAK